MAKKTTKTKSHSGPTEHNKTNPYHVVGEDPSSNLGLLKKMGKQFSTRKAAENEAYRSGDNNPNVMTVTQLKRHNDKIKAKQKKKA